MDLKRFRTVLTGLAAAFVLAACGATLIARMNALTGFWGMMIPMAAGFLLAAAGGGLAAWGRARAVPGASWLEVLLGSIGLMMFFSWMY